MPEEKMIVCHTCGHSVTEVRSVMIRPFDNGKRADDHVKRLASSDPNSPEQQQKFWDEWAQIQKEREYRRAFICEDCYRRIDTFIGVGFVDDNGTRRSWGMAGSSRGGKAASYTYAKWIAYQRRKIKEMGGGLLESLLE